MTGLSRREFLAGAAALATVPGRARGAEPSRPNILLIETDDHWHRALGCMGDAVIQTPNVDALAERGVCFRNNVCQATHCIPSRISLLTGSYPHNNGNHSNLGQGIDETQWTFPAALQRSGYHCALVGKNHLKLDAGTPHERDDPVVRARLGRYGFDQIRPVTGKVAAALGYTEDAYRRYLRQKGLLEKLSRDYRENRKNPLTGLGPSVLDAEDHQDAFIGRLAAEWIDAYSAEKPFFLWLNFVSPHTPCDAPLPYATMYAPAQMPPPVPASFADRMPGLKLEVARFRRMTGPGFAMHFRAAYYGMITFVDVQVGRVLEALERRGLRDDTVVVFCGDQGEMAGDHGLFGKGVFFRGAIGAPLVVSWPRRVRKGVHVDRPVELQDLVPTFLELAGVSDEDRRPCFGESLLPLLTGEGEYARDAAFAEKFGKKMIATSDHKYVYDPAAAGRMLFDLQENPDETRNLAGKPSAAAVERELRERLLAWLAETWRQPRSKPA